MYIIRIIMHIINIYISLCILCLAVPGLSSSSTSSKDLGGALQDQNSFFRSQCLCFMVITDYLLQDTEDLS